MYEHKIEIDGIKFDLYNSICHDSYRLLIDGGRDKGKISAPL